jgi:hypothetical protein
MRPRDLENGIVDLALNSRGAIAGALTETSACDWQLEEAALNQELAALQ